MAVPFPHPSLSHQQPQMHPTALPKQYGIESQLMYSEVVGVTFPHPSLHTSSGVSHQQWPGLGLGLSLSLSLPLSPSEHLGGQADDQVAEHGALGHARDDRARGRLPVDLCGCGVIVEILI